MTGRSRRRAAARALGLGVLVAAGALGGVFGIALVLITAVENFGPVGLIVAIFAVFVGIVAVATYLDDRSGAR